MDFIKRAILSIICISLTSCSIFEPKKSTYKLDGIYEICDEDMVFPYFYEHDTNPSLDLRFYDSDELQYIVNYDTKNEMNFILFLFQSSSYFYNLEIGDFDYLYECESFGRFVIKRGGVYSRIYFSKSLLSTPNEVFLDFSKVENDHIVQICTLIMYPSGKNDDLNGFYKWKVDIIGNYSFPKIDGKYQEITENMTKNYFAKTRKEAKEKYKYMEEKR